MVATAGAESDDLESDDRESDDGQSDGSAPDVSPGEGITIDVSPALHTAGHELEDLGFGDVADSAPLLHDDEVDDVDFDHQMGADMATRGQSHH